MEITSFFVVTGPQVGVFIGGSDRAANWRIVGKKSLGRCPCSDFYLYFCHALSRLCLLVQSGRDRFCDGSGALRACQSYGRVMNYGFEDNNDRNYGS